jgi:hypothetical protein
MLFTVLACIAGPAWAFADSGSAGAAIGQAKVRLAPAL